MELQQYWEVLQQKICHRCLDGDSLGHCRLSASEECAVKAFLPQIIATVNGVKSDSIDDYIAALRRDVCSTCDDAGPGLRCQKRADLECALDRYFPLIVEVIESVRETQEKTGRPDAMPSGR